MRTLLLGATGHFGHLIARRLAGCVGIELTLAGRDVKRVARLADELGVEGVPLDRDAPGFESRLRALSPGLVISAAGPFQSQDYRVARASIAAGSHYVDIADGRGFVCGIRELHAEALDRGLCIVSGASSVPTLSSAVVERLASGLDCVDAIDVGISTSSRPPGVATLRAVLGYAGRDIPQLGEGRAAIGGLGAWHRSIEGVGERWFVPCDVPDLVLLRERYRALGSLRFGAGTELRLARIGIGLVAAAVRSGVLTDASALAPALHAAAGITAGGGTGRSAMYVTVSGRRRNEKLTRTWSLVAANEDGAHIPTRAAVCLARKLASGLLSSRGAFPGVGLVSLDEYVAELQGLNIRTCMSDDSS